MNRAATFVIAALSLTCGLGSGQTNDAPPARPGPPPSPRGEGGFRPGPPGSGDRDGDRKDRGDHGGDRRGGGFWPGFGRPPMRSEEYDKLPEADKKRIREAMDRVWGRPEVIEARERTMRAHADLRETIRTSLARHDPEVAELLKKVEPDDGYDMRQLPPMPAVDSDEFPRAITMRLGMDIMMFSKPDRKEATRLFHEKLMTTEPVQKALQEVIAKRGEERIQASQRLRQVYREAAMQEFQKARPRPPGEGGGKSPPPPDK